MEGSFSVKQSSLLFYYSFYFLSCILFNIFGKGACDNCEKAFNGSTCRLFITVFCNFGKGIAGRISGTIRAYSTPP